jgi:ATP phosphoribosyltransferase
MKLSTISKRVLPGLALLLATGAFAANNANKGSFNVFDPVTVNGHQLSPGQYKLTWAGTGPNVELMILSQGKVVATVPARLIELGQAGHDNATESHKNDDGSQSLTQIDFAGKKYALALGMESAATDSTSQGGGSQ